MCLVSVVMSVYREPIEFITKSIESIIHQTYTNLEIIIVLDNPNYKEAELLIHNFSKNDDRITFMVNEHNEGLTKCLNKALLLTKGDYIARMDADDISDRTRLFEEFEYLKQNHLDLVGCQVRRIDSTGRVVEKCTNISYPSDCIRKTLIYDNCIAHPTWFVKRSVYERLKGYRDIPACEDYDFLLRAINNGFSLGIVSKTLFSYRINENGISGKNRFRQFISCIYLRRHIRDIDRISINDVECYLKDIYTDNRANKYEIGKRRLDKAVECMKNRNFGFISNAVSAVVASKYTWVNIYYIFRIQLIRLKYKKR